MDRNQTCRLVWEEKPETANEVEGLEKIAEVHNGGGRPPQILIKGENLDALSFLQNDYKGKVDCIYIDPPYNTGSTNWKYNNNFYKKGDPDSHSSWLSFMEHRLAIAKTLLNPQKSVLICAIGEDEVHRLALLLEQVFSKDKIHMVTINLGASNTRKNDFTRTNEYLFFVMIGSAGVQRLEIDPGFLLHEEKTKRSAYGSMARTGSNGARYERPNTFYPIFVKGGKIVAIGEAVPEGKHAEDIANPIEGSEMILPIHSDGKEGTWKLSRETLFKYINEHRIWVKNKAIYRLFDNVYEDLKSGIYGDISNFQTDPIDGHYIIDNEILNQRYRRLPTTMWNVPEHSSSNALSLLKSLLGSRAFDYPKSLYAVEDAIRFFVAGNPNALILDFFAGSGTTGHAVMRLNKRDGGKRVSISITNNENKICEEVTFPRLKAAITGVRPDGEKIEGNYKGRDKAPLSDGFKEDLIFYKLVYCDKTRIENQEKKD